LPVRHEVQNGECILSIAERYGFFAETLWNHELNGELRRQRADGTVLAPGDVVWIPERVAKSLSAVTGRRHRFRRRGVPAIFALRLLRDGEPRRDVPWQLVVDQGVTTTGRTNDDGFVVAAISPSARKAKLTVGEGATTETYEFELGSLRPADTDEGATTRLRGLGYDAETLADALAAFQHDHGLTASGVSDSATQAKLREVFGQ
jgi:hypothetical protein